MSTQGASSTPTEKIGWTPPATISPISVLPDRKPPELREADLEAYTKPAELLNMVGKEIEPSRMGIYICLLDERPHLHPNLAALHKHRLVAHSIPLPHDPNVDLPITKGDKEWLTWKYSEEEETRRKAYLPLA